MNQSRLEMLQKFVEEEPNDPFNRYALVLELVIHDPDEAASHFDDLLQRHPDYLPTYYQAGVYFMDRGEQQKSLQILRAGIEVAKQQRNLKTLAELNTLIEDLE